MICTLFFLGSFNFPAVALVATSLLPRPSDGPHRDGEMSGDTENKSETGRLPTIIPLALEMTVYNDHQIT